MEISRAFELLTGCEKILGLLGIRSETPHNIRFTIIFCYLIIPMVLEYADLIQFLDNLEHVVANLTQSASLVLIIVKIILLRWNNRKLETIIEAAKKDFYTANCWTHREMRVFLNKYEKARRIVGAIILFMISTATGLYLGPLINILLNLNRNGTMELNLPYPTRMFYDVTENPAYALTYLFFLPFPVCAAMVYTGSDYLLVTLGLHICGQLSVLVERIDNLNTDHRECGPAIKKLVKMQIRLISMTTSLEESFSLILLAQILGDIVLISFLNYNFLVNRKAGKDLLSADFYNFLSFVCSTVLLLYTFCYIGESIAEESAKVHRAFSECGWENMPTRHSRSIIICMAKSQQLLGLSAGKFYRLSISTFTDMMKTAMAYFSVLRTLM